MYFYVDCRVQNSLDMVLGVPKPKQHSLKGLAENKKIFERWCETPEATNNFFPAVAEKQKAVLLQSALGEQQPLADADSRGFSAKHRFSAFANGSIAETVLSYNLKRIDNVSRHGSQWNPKQRRAYQRAISGVKAGLFRFGCVYHLTLTSGRGRDKSLAHAWDLLVKRVRRTWKLSFHYFKVETTEGNGVFHVIFYGKDWQKFHIGEIHNKFSLLWKELNNSPIVWVTPYNIASKVAGYVVGQYVAGQSFKRMSYSAQWCFRGFVSKFKELLRKFGFLKGIRMFDIMVQNKISFKTQKDLLVYKSPLGLTRGLS